MPQRRIDIMDAGHMRRLFALATVDAFFAAKRRYLVMTYTTEHQLGRLVQWVDVATSAAFYCITQYPPGPNFHELFGPDLDLGVSFMSFARNRYRTATAAEKRLLTGGFARSQQNAAIGTSSYSPDAGILEHDPLTAKEMEVKRPSQFRTVREKYQAWEQEFANATSDTAVWLVRRNLSGA